MLEVTINKIMAEAGIEVQVKFEEENEKGSEGLS